MKLPRRQFLHLTAGAAALPVLPRTAWSLDYPTRPVRIIVGFPAGTAPDITGRVIAQSLSERLGQQFTIDNRPGAASSIATETVAKAPSDAYTLLLALSSNVVNAALYTNLSFNVVRDIAPVAFVGANPFVLVVTPSVPVRTLPEFIAYSKANPGKINMASQGIGTTPHVCGELLKLMTGIEFTHVPYRAPLMPDLLAGQVQFYFAIGEFVPGYKASGWIGVGAPKGTSIELIDKLNKEINALVADAQMKSRLTTLGVEPKAMTPTEFGKFISEEYEKWAEVIRAANVKAE
jgi:tripartite-type tricarboxylate transporter receptor subunit TctC